MLALRDCTQQAASGLQPIAVRTRTSSPQRSNSRWHGRMLMWGFSRWAFPELMVRVWSLWYESLITTILGSLVLTVDLINVTIKIINVYKRVCYKFLASIVVV